MPIPEHKNFSPKNCCPSHELSNTNNATPENVPNTQYDFDKNYYNIKNLETMCQQMPMKIIAPPPFYQTCDADLNDPALSYKTLELGDLNKVFKRKNLHGFLRFM